MRSGSLHRRTVHDLRAVKDRATDEPGKRRREYDKDSHLDEETAESEQDLCVLAGHGSIIDLRA